MFFKKKKSKVIFISNCGSIPHEPAPAVNFIPNWFQVQKSYTSEESKTHAWLKNTIKPSFSPSIKKCIPMRESMTAGYIIPFPYDVAVKCTFDEQIGEPVIGIYAGVPKIDEFCDLKRFFIGLRFVGELYGLLFGRGHRGDPFGE